MTESKKSQWKAWLYAAGIRAIKTFAQAFIACMPVTAATIGQVDWVLASSTACVAAVLSILTSLAGIPEASSPWAEEDKMDGQHGHEV